MLAHAGAVLSDYGEMHFGGGRFVFRNEAVRSVVGRLLATPHEPLAELVPRLQRWLLSQINKSSIRDEQGEVRPGLIFEIALHPDYLRKGQQAIDELVARVCKPTPSLADLEEVKRLLVVLETGQRRQPVQKRAEPVTTATPAADAVTPAPPPEPATLVASDQLVATLEANMRRRDEATLAAVRRANAAVRPAAHGETSRPAPAEDVAERLKQMMERGEALRAKKP
jgi:hypothetical protein